MLDFKVLLGSFPTPLSGQQRILSWCSANITVHTSLGSSLTCNFGLCLSMSMLVTSHLLYSLSMPSLHHQLKRFLLQSKPSEPQSKVHLLTWPPFACHCHQILTWTYSVPVVTSSLFPVSLGPRLSPKTHTELSAVLAGFLFWILAEPDSISLPSATTLALHALLEAVLAFFILLLASALAPLASS